MPKLIPVPDDVSKPFWDAVNERKLIVQSCNDCPTLQYPPKPTCLDCGSENLGWKETSGRGRISTYVVMMDIHLARRVEDSPSTWPSSSWTTTRASTSTPTCRAYRCGRCPSAPPSR